MIVEKNKTTNVDILEKGNIYFFYRPKVEEQKPGSLADIFHELHLEKPEVHAKPLFEGQWE